MIEEFTKYRRHHLDKGQVLLWPDDDINSIFYLSQGIVRIYDIGDSGDERTLLLLSPDIIIPSFIDMFSLGPYTTKYYYDAFTDIEVYRISREEFVGMMDANPPLMRRVVRNIIRTEGEAISHLAALEGKTADEKVRMATDYAKSVVQRAQVRRKVTHQDIANLSALSRETVSASLARMGQK